MKKLLLILLIIILIVFGTLYTLLFTKSGNLFVANYVESSFNQRQDDFKLKFEKFDINFNKINLAANINDSSKISLDGKISSILDVKGEFDYIIDIKDLSIFNNLVKKELKGALFASGDIVTNKGITTIIGTSNIANSSSKYEVNLKDIDINSLKLDLKQANIDELFALLNEPIYSFGKLDLKCNLVKNSSNFFDGDVFLDINSGKIKNSTIEKEFNFPIKQTVNYSLKSSSKIEESKIKSNAKLSSSLANFDINNLIIDLITKQINANYSLDIPKLQNIEEFIKVLLNGDLKVSGNINKNENSLKIDGKSSIAGGSSTFELLNDNLDFKIKNANTLKFLYLLNKDEFFSSNLNLDLKYNISTKIGNSNIDLSNGHFVRNNFIQKVEEFTKFDLSKEIFQTGNINSKIENKKIYSDINLESKNSDIKSKNGFIDLEKNQIDTKLDINLNKNKFSIKLEDDLNKPNIIFDVQDLIKNALEKKLDKYLNKEEDGSKKELLKGIKSLF